MRRTYLALVLLCCGCAQYTEAQMQLVRQVKHGVELCREGDDQQRQLAAKLFELERRRLDEAFDADVQERADAEGGRVSPDWVLEHRRAYAVGVDAMAQQRFASQEAGRVMQSNLAAMEQALDRLEWMQRVQMKWTGKGGMTNDGNQNDQSMTKPQ